VSIVYSATPERVVLPAPSLQIACTRCTPSLIDTLPKLAIVPSGTALSASVSFPSITSRTGCDAPSLSVVTSKSP
jgi:hypothetical protein